MAHLFDRPFLALALGLLAVKLFDINALKFGDFITKTGIKTPVYFDLRVIISHPKLMEHVATLLWTFSKELGEVSQICGIPYTALPIATLISTQSNVPMLIKRKEAKCYGTKKIVEGQFEEGQSCVIIEDIVTSGSSILETVSTLRGAGLKVSDAFVVIDREQGGRRNIEASGVRMRSLYTLTQILGYLEEAGKVSQSVVQGVLDYLKDNQVQLQESNITDDSKERTRMRFSARAKFAKNPAASRLLRLMESKQTMLCLAVDLTDSNSILELIELAGPHMAVIKTHVDIVEDFSQQFIDRLKLLADKHDFLIMEDRKFSDIGHTASLQYAKGIYRIAKWADFVTAHPVSGSGVLSGLRDGCSDISEARGVFLVATMSSKGNLTSGDYVEKAVAMATSSDLVAGVVAQSNLIDSEPGLIQLTPGVQLTENADDLGQQYNTPESVVKAGADLVVVGRGITAAKDKLSAILKFKERLWTAYKCYANEVGEAFRGVVLKSVVWLSYVVATGYVLADTVHKSLQIYQKDTTPDKKKYVILSASDTLLWQSFASVIIPGFTINRLCAAVRYVQRKSNGTMKGPWVPIAVGLASIPLIVHPIDVAVEETMNVSYRKWTGYHPKEPLDRIREKD